MEQPNYSMSDRYSDIIKSMWFVFMYATLIPLVIILFLVGMILFYWIDKVLFKTIEIKFFLNYFNKVQPLSPSNHKRKH